MRLKTLLVLVICLLFAFAVVGCGDDDSDSATDTNQSTEQTEDSGGKTETAGTKLSLSADPDGALKYNTDKLATKPGKVEVYFDNPSSTTHDVAIADSDDTVIGQSDQIADSNTEFEIEDLPAGSYSFYCTLPGHRDGGMEGTLTVK